jgi:ureidoglycolate hydrolase
MSIEASLRTIRAKPLSAGDFAAFGQVLEMPANGRRQDYAGALSQDDAGLKPNLAVIRAEPSALPLVVRTLERHPRSSQAFMPLSVARYLVLVCPGDAAGRPDTTRLHAFIARGDQAINYNRGTWHHGMTTLGEPGTFAMFMWDEMNERDTEFTSLVQPLRVDLHD